MSALVVLNISVWEWQNKMVKILVVGGAGYIGSHVVKALLQEGMEILVFDNLSSGHKVNLFSEAEFFEGDILDYAKLSEAMAKNIDAVIHLAAKKAVGESMEKPELYAKNNLIGSINILNAMLENNVNNIVFSSSASVYGNAQYLPIDEKHPLNPASFYAYSKKAVEEYMDWYSITRGMKYVSLRYFNAAGYDEAGDIKGRDANPQNLLPIIIEVLDGKREVLQIFGDDYDTKDGTCVRDYIHVSDLASAHVLAIKYLVNGGASTIYNLGTQNGVSVKEVVAATEKVYGRKLPVKYSKRRAGDPEKLWASSEKAFNELGWKPKYLSIEDIIRTEAKK